MEKPRQELEASHCSQEQADCIHSGAQIPRKMLLTAQGSSHTDESIKTHIPQTYPQVNLIQTILTETLFSGDSSLCQADMTR